MKICNFVIDIGNTNIGFGVYHEDNLVHSWRCETRKTENVEFYYRNILDHANTIGFDLKKITKIAVSSVVPALKDTFQKLVNIKFNCQFIFVDAHTELGLSFPMTDPGFIGSDLIINAYSALQKYQTSCLICDFGTATTFQLFDSNGFFYGSAIAPGIHTAANSLFQNASQLFKIDFSTPAKLMGTSTKDSPAKLLGITTNESMLSGILNGNLFMMEGFIRSIKKEYQHLNKIMTIATGGMADVICRDSKEIDLIDSNLLLDGLNFICEKLEDNA